MDRASVLFGDRYAGKRTLFRDARSASRWRPVCDRIDGGRPTKAFPKVQIRFESYLRRYLQASHAISSDVQLGQHVEMHYRYRREWLDLIAEARQCRLPRVAPSRSPALAQGATQ
ncbi:hypothetical protein ACYOEI_27285 [Singulisphaera rosea]